MDKRYLLSTVALAALVLGADPSAAAERDPAAAGTVGGLPAILPSAASGEATGRALVVRRTAERRGSAVYLAGAVAAGALAIAVVGAAALYLGPSGEKKIAAPAPALAPRPAAPAAQAELPAPRLPRPDRVAQQATPDLAGTVRKIAGATRFEIGDRWIELYGVDDPTTAGEHNLTVYQYLKPFAGHIECYRKGDRRFACFVGGHDLAIIAINRGLVQLTADAPVDYRTLAQPLVSADRKAGAGLVGDR